MTTYEQVLAVAVALAPALCCIALARRRAPGRLALVLALGTAAVALAWDRHRAPYEGPNILQVSATHALTMIDLVVPAALAVSGAVLWRYWRG